MTSWDDLDPFQQWALRYAILGHPVERSHTPPNSAHFDGDAFFDGSAHYDGVEELDPRFVERFLEAFSAWYRQAEGESPFDHTFDHTFGISAKRRDALPPIDLPDLSPALKRRLSSNPLLREFLRWRDGQLGLIAMPDRQLATDMHGFGVGRIEQLARRGHDLRKLKPREFEQLIAELWHGFGYDVDLTKQTRDGGKDIIAILRRPARVKFLIECKAPPKANQIGSEPVRALLGVKVLERATKGILATTVRFSPDAKAIFEQSEWELEGRDRDGVLNWIRDYLADR